MTGGDTRRLSNQEVMALNNDIYNGFWRKYRDQPLPSQSSAWEGVVGEAKALARKYGCHPMAVHQLQDYLDQLEARAAMGKAMERETEGDG